MNNAPCVCELYNIISQVGEVDLGHGLRLKQITKAQLEVIDRSTHSYPRRQCFAPWFLEQEPQVDYSKHVDGDPTGAIRLFRIALVLCFGEEVKFGPRVCIREMEAGDLGGMVIWDSITERFPAGRPNEFCITSDNIGRLTTLFSQLLEGFRAPLLKIPVDRLVAAKTRKVIAPDAIVDQSIALEALYLSKDTDKGKTLAQRGAAFLGINDADRQEIYVNLRSFYKARNKILHEGEEHPTVHLKTCTRKDTVQLQDWCFKHLREAIRKLLADNRYFTMDKASFVSELKNIAKTWKSQFECVDKQNF